MNKRKSVRGHRGMKKEVENRIITIAETYIKESRKRKLQGVTSKELKEYTELRDDNDINNYHIGKALAASNKFNTELKYSSKYRQELNHWKLK